MIQETHDLLAALDRLTHQLVDIFAAVPADAVDWKPGPETNSAAAIVTHALGATRNWVITYVGGKSIDRDREMEFLAASGDVADFRQRALDWLSEAAMALEPLTTADLDAPAPLPPSAQQSFPGLTVRGAAMHALEHLGLHLGHLELTLQLWNMLATERSV